MKQDPIWWRGFRISADEISETRIPPDPGLDIEPIFESDLKLCGSSAYDRTQQRLLLQGAVSREQDLRTVANDRYAFRLGFFEGKLRKIHSKS